MTTAFLSAMLESIEPRNEIGLCYCNYEKAWLDCSVYLWTTDDGALLLQSPSDLMVIEPKVWLHMHLPEARKVSVSRSYIMDNVNSSPFSLRTHAQL